METPWAACSSKTSRLVSLPPTDIRTHDGDRLHLARRIMRVPYGPSPQSKFRAPVRTHQYKSRAMRRMLTVRWIKSLSVLAK